MCRLSARLGPETAVSHGAEIRGNIGEYSPIKPEISNILIGIVEYCRNHIARELGNLANPNLTKNIGTRVKLHLSAENNAIYMSGSFHTEVSLDTYSGV